MTITGTILTGHFKGGKNLNEGQRHRSETILEEFLEQAQTSIAALEAFQAGLRDPKDSVRLATAAALPACTAAGSGVGKTLTADANGALTVDGNAVADGDRVLVKNQVAGKDNGPYVATSAGGVAAPFVLTRATDADSDTEVTSMMIVPVEEGDENANTVWYLTTAEPFTLDTDALTFAEYTPNEHAAAHIQGGGDEVDGDQIDIDLTPSNYSPSTTPAEVDDVDQLSAHLAGIDDELADVAQHEGSVAVAQFIQSGQPVATNLLTVGADVYEADGAGANINFAIGVSAEATLDNLLAAAVASGTEDLYWDKLSATVLRIRSADGPQGTVIAADPSVSITNALTNWATDVGDVNLNTLAGRAAAKTAMETAVLTITTAMITATTVRLDFPFVVDRFTFSATSAGVPVAFTADALALDNDGILVTLGTDLANGDVLTVTAYS